MATSYDDITFKEDEIGSDKWVEVATWCNEYGIQDNKGFYIKKCDDELYRVTEYELPPKSKEQEIEELKEFLRNTDNYALRLQTSEAKPEDISSTYNCTFAEIMIRRSEARARIAELEN